MKITLLHPSRGRPHKANQTYNYWTSVKGNVEIEHILSVDSNDPELEEYKIYKPENSILLVSDNTSVVEATNAAAKIATGDILVYLSDDFKCPLNWDTSLVKVFTNTGDPLLVKVNDCLQPFNADVLTIPIMNRALYERLGYFWHPDYKSMFVDQDLYYVCKNNNWMVLRSDLKFPHEHHTSGLTPNDETYQRSNANWDQGKEVYERRRANGFV